MAPEEAIRTVQMVLGPSQGRPLPPVHLESVSPGLLLPPAQVTDLLSLPLAVSCAQHICAGLMPHDP